MVYALPHLVNWGSCNQRNLVALHTPLLSCTGVDPLDLGAINPVTQTPIVTSLSTICTSCAVESNHHSFLGPSQQCDKKTSWKSLLTRRKSSFPFQCMCRFAWRGDLKHQYMPVKMNGSVISTFHCQIWVWSSLLKARVVAGNSNWCCFLPAVVTGTAPGGQKLRFTNCRFQRQPTVKKLKKMKMVFRLVVKLPEHWPDCQSYAGPHGPRDALPQSLDNTNSSEKSKARPSKWHWLASP